MPELPEMETYRRRLEDWMAGRVVIAIKADRPKRVNRPAAELTSILGGHPVARVDRRGKSLAILIDSPAPLNTLYVHLMLGGRISLAAEDKPAAVVLALGGNRPVYFHLSLGRIDALTHSELKTRWSQLGVEPLSPDYSPALLAQAFSSSARPIKTCLMDQQVIAGIGNVYSDEILYHAAIYPGTPAMLLTPKNWSDVGRLIPEVLSQAVEQGGVGPAMDPDDRTTGRYRTHLAVHYRQHQSCGIGGTVVTERIGGRTSYWCPSVQQRP